MADFPSNYRTMIVKDAVYPKAGNLLNYDATTGAGTVDLTAADDAAFFVALDESSRDADQDLLAAGATITAMPIGGMMYVLAVAAEAWVAGQVLYVVAAGLASKTASATPSKVLGHYLGSATTTAAGILYAVNTKQTN
tara:strand:+ start:1748 stop:2161 length:414 start_codon:yes stop_codon:yes gene_type:complete